MDADLTHTEACVAARGGPDRWPRVGGLAPGGVEAVLACPHPAHDSFRHLRLGALSSKAEARAAR